MASLALPVTAVDEAADEEVMPDDELLSILTSHEAQAIGYQPGSDDEVSSQQQRAINYYYRIMDDVPAQEGSSSVVDGTVQVVIDNALAAILKPFVSSDETVMFAPRQPEDVDFAEQATEYVNYIFNCDNPGFLILHDWFKDALLTKLGVVKAWWEAQPRLDKVETPIEDEMHAMFLRQRPDYLGEEGGIAYHGQQVDDGRVKVEVIPPEEFRVSPFTRKVSEAIYAAHVPTNIIRSDLIEMGFEPEVVESIPADTAPASDNSIRLARYHDERVGDDRTDSPHSSQDRIALRDEYVRLDYDGDGVAETRRIVRVGDTILLNEEVQRSPFATICPIPMPHKVFGLSLADLVTEDQKINTVLWRQMLDNLYKSNNPRPVLGEGGNMTDGSTAETLSDNAPGAVVLVRDLSQFRYDAVPYTADASLPMLEMVGNRIEEKTGISRTGQGLDTNALRKSGQMTATEMAMIAGGKNARVEMMARIFAETGVKELFKLILDLVTKHQPKERMIRLRNKWVPVDPRGWPEMDVEISVGLGIGEKSEQIAVADSILETQAAIAQSPFAQMVGPENVFNAFRKKLNAGGVKNIEDFVTPPDQLDPQQEKPDPEMEKVKADAMAQQAKLELQMQESQAKLQQQREEAMLKQQLAREEAQFEADLAIEKMNREFALAEQKMVMETQLAERRAELDAQSAYRDADRRDRETDAKISANRSGGDLDK